MLTKQMEADRTLLENVLGDATGRKVKSYFKVPQHMRPAWLYFPLDGKGNHLPTVCQHVARAMVKSQFHCLLFFKTVDGTPTLTYLPAEQEKEVRESLLTYERLLLDSAVYLKGDKDAQTFLEDIQDVKGFVRDMRIEHGYGDYLQAGERKRQFEEAYDRHFLLDGACQRLSKKITGMGDNNLRKPLMLLRNA